MTKLRTAPYPPTVSSTTSSILVLPLPESSALSMAAPAAEEDVPSAAARLASAEWDGSAGAAVVGAEESP